MLKSRALFKHLISFNFIIMLIGCSQPVSMGKFTQPLNPAKNTSITKVIFNNLKNDEFYLDEHTIETNLLKKLTKKISTLQTKSSQLIINLIDLKEYEKEVESQFNIHNILAVAVFLQTGYEADTSEIDINSEYVYRFVLDIKLENQDTTKLFIEVSKYSDEDEVRELFEEELLKKIKEIF